MTKHFRASGREYQRSPAGAPDGVLSNVFPRETYATGVFDVSSESTRVQLKDLSANFSNSQHLGRMVYFPFQGVNSPNTPPTGGTAGTGLHDGWFYRITAVVSATVVQLEGFRAEVAGSNIKYNICASADFTAASALFPQDTGPTGTNTDTLNRSNTGPCEWQALSFPLAADSRLRIYPFWIMNRISGTSVRICDPFDNLATFPTESSLVWFLRDRPAYTHEQMYKIVHTFMLQAGWSLFQHRGNNNGVSAGGNAQNNSFCVHDMIYNSVGENNDQVMYLRWCSFNKGGNGNGTDAQQGVGFDAAFFSSWDRSYAPLTVPSGGGATTNQGNGIGPLSSSFGVTNNGWAGVAEALNTTNLAGPYFNATNVLGGSGPIEPNVRWSNPKDHTSASRRVLQNSLNTPEGGEIAELRYYLFGDKDEVHIIIEGPATGTTHLGLGNLKARPDSNPFNYKTNFSTAVGSNVLLRVGGPGTADGQDPTTLTPPYQVGDRIQTVGMKVISSTLIVPGTSFAGELIDSSTITNLPGKVPAIGTLITQAGSLISDGNTFIIDDGLGNPLSIRTYEFDKNSSVTAGNIAVTITGASTADQVRDAIRDAINPTLAANYTWNGSTTVTSPDTSAVVVNDWIRLATNTTNQAFQITAINPNVSVTIANPDGFTIPTGSGAASTRKSKHAIWTNTTVSGRVDLTNGRKGGQGNHTVTDSGPSFTTGTEGMSGGGYAIEIATVNSSLVAGALVGEDPQPLFFFRPAFSGTTLSSTGGVQGIFRLSNRSNNADATYRDHNGPTIATGLGFNALAETAGLFGADTNEINPNERTGRFSACTIMARDTAGGQIRGSMRYCRVVSKRMANYALRRDRNGDWHFILQNSNSTGSAAAENGSTSIQLAFGPMPTAMAFVS